MPRTSAKNNLKADKSKPSAFDPIPPKATPPEPPPKKKAPNFIPVNIVDVERYASHGLSRGEIAACLGMSAETFYRKAGADPQIEAAYERGRTIKLSKIAKVVIDIAESEKEEARDRLKACEIYLKRNGDNWKDKSRLEIEHSGGVSVKTSLDEESLLRAAQTYAKLKGGDQDAALDDA